MKKNTFHYQSYKNVDSILGNNALEIALYGYNNFSFLNYMNYLSLVLLIYGLTSSHHQTLFHPKAVFKPPCNVTDQPMSHSTRGDSILKCN